LQKENVLSLDDSLAKGTPSGGDLNAATDVIHLDPGETVTCTFTNNEVPFIYFMPVIVVPDENQTISLPVICH